MTVMDKQNDIHVDPVEHELRKDRDKVKGSKKRNWQWV